MAANILNFARYVAENYPPLGNGTRTRARVTTMRDPLTREQQQLVESCMRLVPFLAKKYRWHSLAFEDLCAWGNLGLVDAAQRFDPARGIEFGTYAGYWIRARILSAVVNESGMCKSGIWNRAFWKFWTDMSTEKIAALYNLDADELDRIKGIVINGHVRLDATAGEKKIAGFSRRQGPSLIETIPDPNQPHPDTDIEREQLTAEVRAAIATLPKREQKIIHARYGDEPQTLTEIGQQIGRSRERVRVLEQEALLKLRRILDRKVA